jgi:hypothetical protein
MKPSNESLDLFIDVGFLNLHNEAPPKLNFLFGEATVHLKNYINENQQYPKSLTIHFTDASQVKPQPKEPQYLYVYNEDGYALISFAKPKEDENCVGIIKLIGDK